MILVVEKKSEKMEKGTRLTCTAYTVFKNVDITITVNDQQYEQSLMLGEAVPNDNTVLTGETRYTVAEPTEMISKSVLVDDQHAEVRCSVTYHNDDLWFGLLSEKKGTRTYMFYWSIHSMPQLTQHLYNSIFLGKKWTDLFKILGNRKSTHV